MCAIMLTQGSVTSAFATNRADANGTVPDNDGKRSMSLKRTL